MWSLRPPPAPGPRVRTLSARENAVKRVLQCQHLLLAEELLEGALDPGDRLEGGLDALRAPAAHRCRLPEDRGGDA